MEEKVRAGAHGIERWRAAAADLLFGASCVVCGQPGLLLCGACTRALPERGRSVPAPAGLSVPVCAAAEYERGVKAMIVGHKEDGLAGLAPALSRLLALAVLETLDDGLARRAVMPDRLVVVPVPSRAAAVRERGEDPSGRLVRGAVRLLSDLGMPVVGARLLRVRPGVVDQAGLDQERRARNLDGAFAARAASLAALAGQLRDCRPERVRVVVCDDVVTTGATAAEACRALEAVGLRAHAVASVAATRRRRPGTPTSGESLSWAPADD